MTDQELKDLVASLAVGNAELRASQRVTDEQMRVTDEQMRATDEQMRATDKQMKEQSREMKEQMRATDKKLKSLGIHLDGITKTTGEDAEEFFYSSLTAKDLKLGNMRFDVATKNLLAKKDGRSHEIDIFLENGDSVAIIEVKNKVKQQSLEQLDHIIENFYEFHPAFKNYKIQGAIAGKIFSEDLQKRALNKGFIVLTQQGNHIETLLP